LKYNFGYCAHQNPTISTFQVERITIFTAQVEEKGEAVEKKWEAEDYNAVVEDRLLSLR
jgi:hypothetical protein